MNTTEILQGIKNWVDKPAKLGFGVGVCSTAAATAAKTVSITDFKLKTNGFVAVTFDYDVQAGATLNVNTTGAKPIIYRGTAIIDDVIKAGDTVIFAYNGTNYVISSVSRLTVLNEVVNIDLTQLHGYDADLIGATITLTNNDTSSTIFSTTWQGRTVSVEVQKGVSYTVAVGSVTGYLSPSSQTYTAGEKNERDISFKYFALGAYVESTDGELYRSADWPSSGKTANSVVFIASQSQFRISLTPNTRGKTLHSNNTDNLNAYLSGFAPSYSYTDYDGKGNTEKILQFNVAYNTDTLDYCVPYCLDFTFPDGVTKGYLPAAGQWNIVYNNKTAISQCLVACGGDALVSSTTWFWTSTASTDNKVYINRDSDNNNTAWNMSGGVPALRVFGDFEI